MSSVDQQSIGKRGESYVCLQLRNKGWRILQQNYRCPFAELDIVAKDSLGNLVIVEVKTRASFRWLDGYDCVSRKQLRRLSQACLYLGERNYCSRPARLDLVLVKHSAAAGIESWQHLSDLDLID
ncbi:MAG: putative endonuclease [Myxococcota bacterium]|jgi:putative endonuclease